MKKKTKEPVASKKRAFWFWRHTYGESTVAQDFAGRIIAKGAYQDRNSEYGWDIDYTWPPKRSRYIREKCCNIRTIEERKNKFPCFKANGIAFETVQVGSKAIPFYYIRRKYDNAATEPGTFYDGIQGCIYLKKLREERNKKFLAGSIVINMYNLTDISLVDFVAKMFEDANVTFHEKEFYDSQKDVTDKITQVRVSVHNLDSTVRRSELLNRCTCLDTYFRYLFLEEKTVSRYNIYYRLDSYESKLEMSRNEFKYTDELLLKEENTFYINSNLLELTNELPSYRPYERYKNSDFIGVSFFYCTYDGLCFAKHYKL